jgi:predicted metalloprotease
LVFAHEWGHVIQDQVDIMTRYRSILMENQADCFAGAWTAHSLENRTGTGFRASENDLQAALAGMLRFSDSPGTDVRSPGAHGSGFDRVNGFQEGFEQGPKRCAAFVDDPPVFVNLTCTPTPRPSTPSSSVSRTTTSPGTRT